MKELIEVVRILSKKNTGKTEVFDAYSLRQSGSKLVIFFNAIKNGAVQTDEEAAKLLYQASPDDDRYRQLKSRFRRRLLDTFFLLDTQALRTSGYLDVLYACRRRLSLIYAFKAHGAAQIALAEAVRLQKTALQYRLAEVVVASAALLREIYAENDDEKHFKNQNELLERYRPVLEAEQKSEEWVQIVRMAYRRYPIPPANLWSNITSACDELLRISGKFESPVISVNAFEAWMLRFEMEDNHDAAEEVAEQAAVFFRRHQLWADSGREILFLLGQLRAALHRKDFKKGRATAERAFRLVDAKDPRRFEIMELLLLISVHSGSVLHAFAVFKEAVELGAFNLAAEERQSKWEIFSPYLHLLMELRPRAQQFALLPKRQKFKVAGFVEDSIPYLPQRENQTFLIAVAQILFLLHLRNLPDAARLIEWLYNIFQASSRKETFRRQGLFIKLLYRLHLSGYQPEPDKKSRQLLAELSNCPIRYRGQLNRMEVMPYEMLWEMVLGFFK